MPVKVDNEGEATTIYPGDYIVADLNGVVCIPAKLAEQAIKLIPSQAEADARIAKDLCHGALFVEASKDHRAALKKV